MVEKKVVITTGKRKTAIAKAVTRKGTGIVRINSILLDIFQPELAREKIKETIYLAEDVIKGLNIFVTITGGGWQAQSEAARMAIAKGIVEWTKDEKLKRRFIDYNRFILVADTRRTEPQKPYRSAARRRKQTSKR